MRTLISGGAGFIGSHVADALQSAGHHVLILDNFSTGNMKNIMQFLADGGKYRQADVRLCDGDISIFETVSDVFRTFRPEAVIHLAAQAAISTSIENPIQDLTVNGIGTLNMLAAAKKYEVKRFVFSSTSAVYRASKFFSTKEDAPLEPNTPYGVSKLAAEMYVRSMFRGAVVLRFGNVYGPRQVPIGENQLLSRMIRHFKYGDKFFIFGSGDQKRDYVYVTDVVEAIICSLYGDASGTYNIATGRSTSVNEIAALVEDYYGVPGYKWEHTSTEDPRRKVCMDVTAAACGLGWKAQVGIKEGVIKTADWWEKKI